MVPNIAKELFTVLLRTSGAGGQVISAIYTVTNHIVLICSGITRCRVLNVELYAQRLQKLIYLHLFTDCFMKISIQSMGQSCSKLM